MSNIQNFQLVKQQQKLRANKIALIEQLNGF